MGLKQHVNNMASSVKYNTDVIPTKGFIVVTASYMTLYDCPRFPPSTEFWMGLWGGGECISKLAFCGFSLTSPEKVEKVKKV